MANPAGEIEESPEFRKLVASRWATAIVLSFLVFFIYYGFILLVGLSKATLAKKIGEVTTIGIPMAVMVIVLSFLLTLIYVGWANSRYDKMVTNLTTKLK